MDAAMIIQGLIGALGVVLWYLYTEIRKELSEVSKDFLSYKVHVAETFVTTDQLTRVTETLNRNVETVASGVVRIESRLNQLIDNRSHPI